LQARLALAECELLTNLGTGRQALEMILEQVPAVADPLQRGPIEAQVLSGLVDNLVFAGDMAAARNHAARLRPLLPGLRADVRIHACEVLIELAMREPDIAAAWSLLSQVKLLSPNSPSTLSFEGQIHWFSGNALAARDAFEALLAQHPAYCSGLTIENDLAVMLFALGDLARAETMARRSLVSWAGVAHTESLSLLVLGSILTSAGRFDEALDALNQAHRLGVDQGSALFVAEAQVRRARLQLQRGQVNAALQDLDEADTALHGSTDPLRVSQYAVIRLDCQIAAGLDPDRTLIERVQALTERSTHPLMLVRLARMQAVLALADGQRELAAQAAQRQADTARTAGLLEPLADALLLLASVASSDEERKRLAGEALELADRQGFNKTSS
jgi:tetratricopeptide (TPR) repeat protein